MAGCVFCNAILSPATKPEHIWLSALNGRKTTRSLICDGCNNAFGSGPDKALAESVEFIRNHLNLKSAKGNAPPVLTGPNIGALQTKILPGGKPTIQGGKPFDVERLEDGTIKLQISTPDNPDALLKAVTNATKYLNISPEQILQSAQVRLIAAPAPAHHQRISLGGPEAMRSMAKTCLLLWADKFGADEIRKSTYQQAMSFARRGSDAFARNKCLLDFRTLDGDARIKEIYSPHYNIAHVCSDDAGRVLGYFRLYNVCGWRIELCQSGGIPNCSATFISNPKTGNSSEELTASLKIDFAWIDAGTLDNDYEGPRNAFVSMNNDYRQTAISQGVSDIVDSVIQGRGIADDQPLSLEEAQEITQQIAMKTTRLFLGIPHEETLSPQQIANLLNGRIKKD